MSFPRSGATRRSAEPVAFAVVSPISHITIEDDIFIQMFAFRWKDGVTDQQKQRAMEESKALVGKIPRLLEVWVGKNISPRGQGFEHGGAMRFADRDELEAYGGTRNIRSW